MNQILLRFARVLTCCWCAAISLKAPISNSAEIPAVASPKGETRLADIGIYQVSWQSYGREPVAMPLSWSGHFEDRTGISFQKWGKVLGRESFLMHSPWRVPPGKEWVDYRLTLPPITPSALSFGITMGPDVAMPSKSDGVTFSCSLFADGKEHPLMRKHHDQAAWIDYWFDLSPYGGKTITIRLQVEPGPKTNASFD